MRRKCILFQNSSGKFFIESKTLPFPVTGIFSKIVDFRLSLFGSLLHFCLEFTSSSNHWFPRLEEVISRYIHGRGAFYISDKKEDADHDSQGHNAKLQTQLMTSHLHFHEFFNCTDAKTSAGSDAEETGFHSMMVSYRVVPVKSLFVVGCLSMYFVHNGQ